MKKISDKSQITKLAAIVFFTCLLIWGLKVYDAYGISSDEEMERRSSLITFAYIFPEVKETVNTETAPYWSYPDLTEWRDKYYGMAAQLPVVFIEYLNDFQMTEEQIYHMRHLYTFLVYFVAVIFFYCICRRIFGDGWMPLLGTAMLVLMPRILANSFYNIKDIMAMSFLIISSYFAVRFIDRITVPDVIGLAVFGAVATNVRIVCALVPVAALSVAFIKSIRSGKWKRTAICCLATGALSLAFYILITPVLWHDTVEGLVNTIRTFSSYTTWDGSNFYMGEWISGSATPWHYMLVWIGITTPLLYLALCLFGFISFPFVRHGRLRKITDQDWNLIYFILILTVPLLYAILRRPVFYNGWRHYYFIYPAIVILAVWGFSRILNLLQTKVWARRAVWSIMGIYLTVVGFWILRNHPYENVYFNTVGRVFAEDNFEKDYYLLSEYQGLQTLLNYDSSSSIKVWLRSYNIMSKPFLPEEDQKRIERGNIAALDEVDYIIDCYTGPVNEYDLFDKIYEESVDGIPIYGIFQRTYARSYDSEVEWDGYTFLSKLDGINWSVDAEGETEWLTGVLDDVTYGDLIYLSGTVEDLSSVQVQYSDDGITWNLMTAVSYEDSQITLRTNGEAWRYIRVSTTCIPNISSSFDLKIYSRLENDENGTSHQNVIIKADSELNQKYAENVFDTDISSGWTTGIWQEDGILFEIQLNDIYEVSQVLLYTDSSTDYARGLKISYSCDGENYVEIEDVETDDHQTYRFGPVSCMYLKFELADIPDDVVSNWTISDIALYSEITEQVMEQ